ncbi:hypothetical protein C6P45_002853 [Maudiozyma exigua]|uniref:Mtf2-like C-terminal domain-containing protein n=1 Tax=Maudiozyma exigua TaxID=34358 RepID=A0A9P6WCA1_MAUEX|nr:hypothetical protein C6P45_002853 [Kazachstania exigua]
MLRYNNGRILQLGIRNSLRQLHANVYSFQELKDEMTEISLDNTDTAEKLKSDDTLDDASVKERMIFGSIFERMQQKEELRKKRMSEIFHAEEEIMSNKIRAGSSGMSRDSGEVKVNFGQHDQYEGIDPSDINLVEYFKQESEKRKINDTLFSKKIDNTKKGDKGKSSIIYDLFENIEKSILQNKKKTLEHADVMRIDNFSPSSLPDASTIQSQQKYLKLDIKKLEAEERYKAAMDTAMKPYINSMAIKVTSDYDILEKMKQLIELFTSRDKSLDALNNNQPVDIINSINKCIKKDAANIPQPYVITIPYTILRLLTGPEFEILNERKYSIAIYVYQRCKTCQDLSLYLNVCNIGFYNLLLKLSWENFKDIKRLLDLTAEMNTNGILGDIETVETLDTLIQGVETTYDSCIPMEDELDHVVDTAKGILWTNKTRIYLYDLKKYLQKLKVALTIEE